MLLDQINTPFVRSNPSVLQGLLRIIPYLSFGELEKMRILVERFKPCCSFDKWASLSFHLQNSAYIKFLKWLMCRSFQPVQTTRNYTSSESV